MEPTPTGPPPSPTGQAQLPIPPIIQETTVWCWAATAAMVLQYEGLPSVNQFGDYQCGIVAAWFGSSSPQCLANCGLCQYTIGPMSSEWQVLTAYGAFLQTLGIPARVLSADLLFSALTASDIKEELDARRPIVVGIAPGGGFALPNASQHIALVVGYDFSSAGQFVIVNDPFPFDLFPYSTMPHPYLSLGAQRLRFGQYRIALQAFTLQLHWANTIYRIR